MAPRLCPRHSTFDQPMCLIPSPANPQQAVLQVQQPGEAGEAQKVWHVEPDGTLRSASGGVLTLNHRAILVIAPQHIISSGIPSHRHMQHQYHVNQHWKHEPDGRLCLLPTLELCIVTEPDNHIFRPAIRSHMHDKHIWQIER